MERNAIDILYVECKFFCKGHKRSGCKLKRKLKCNHSYSKCFVERKGSVIKAQSNYYSCINFSNIAHSNELERKHN